MKLLLLAFIISISTFSVSAQIERQPVGSRPDSGQSFTNASSADKQSRRDRFRELDLTREQTGRLKQIVQAGKAEKQAIENNDGLSEQDKKKQVHELQRAQAQKIQAILTPEQREKFKASKPGNS